MNSLKFINEQIEIMNRKIKFLNSKLNRKHTGITDPLELDLTIEAIQTALSYATQTLQILNQIKNILEAWEETQKYLILNEGYYPLYDSFFEYLTLKNDCIDESNSEEEGVSLTIIKKGMVYKNDWKNKYF